MKRGQPGRCPRTIAALIVCLLPTVLVVGHPLSAQEGPAPSVTQGAFTAAQADRGAATFKEACAACHNIAELGGARFRAAWKDQSLGDLFEFLTSAMPQGDPGSLSPAEYTSLIAYILGQSGYPAGSRELPVGKEPLSAYKLVPLP